MRWLRRRIHKPAPSQSPRGWFPLAAASEAGLTNSQRRLLERAREHLAELSPARARAEDSWASLERQSAPTDWKRHPVAVHSCRGQAPRQSAGWPRRWRDRRRMAGSPLRGDDDGQEAFRAEVVEGTEDEAIAELLSWVQRE